MRCLRFRHAIVLIIVLFIVMMWGFTNALFGGPQAVNSASQQLQAAIFIPVGFIGMIGVAVYYIAGLFNDCNGYIFE